MYWDSYIVETLLNEQVILFSKNVLNIPPYIPTGYGVLGEPYVTWLYPVKLPNDSSFNIITPFPLYFDNKILYKNYRYS